MDVKILGSGVGLTSDHLTTLPYSGTHCAKFSSSAVTLSSGEFLIDNTVPSQLLVLLTRFQRQETVKS